MNIQIGTLTFYRLKVCMIDTFELLFLIYLTYEGLTVAYYLLSHIVMVRFLVLFGPELINIPMRLI